MNDHIVRDILLTTYTADDMFRWLFPAELARLCMSKEVPWAHTEFFHMFIYLRYPQMLYRGPVLLQPYLYDLLSIRDQSYTRKLSGYRLYKSLVALQIKIAKKIGSDLMEVLTR